jgi:hypothetical protein
MQTADKNKTAIAANLKKGYDILSRLKFMYPICRRQVQKACTSAPRSASTPRRSSPAASWPPCWPTRRGRMGLVRSFSCAEPALHEKCHVDRNKRAGF